MKEAYCLWHDKELKEYIRYKAEQLKAGGKEC